MLRCRRAREATSRPHARDAAASAQLIDLPPAAHGDDHQGPQDDEALDRRAIEQDRTEIDIRAGMAEFRHRAAQHDAAAQRAADHLAGFTVGSGGWVAIRDESSVFERRESAATSE